MASVKKAAVQVEPKAKARGAPKQKAEKPEPKVEAKAKAKGAPKSKTEPKAPQPPLALVHQPEEAEYVDKTETVVVRKKNRRKGKKEESDVVAEVEDSLNDDINASEQDVAASVRIRTAHDRTHNELHDKIQQELLALPDISSQEGNEAVRQVGEQRKALDRIVLQIDETLKTVKISRPKNLNTGKIMEQMRELRLCKDDGTFTEATKRQMLEDVENALSKALAFESFRSFQAEMLKLKEQCEERLTENEKIVKNARAGNAILRVKQRVAAAKNMKVEELTEEVVSLEVSLPLETTANLPLYQRKFEKQYSVLIDRPDGAKGSSKGTITRPPTSLIVRGFDAEVVACGTALRQLSLVERQAFPVTAKQAASIMGPQQANARKIEQEFKGVLLRAEASQVVCYGPTAKEVEKVRKYIETIKNEEPAVTVAPTMTLDKDLARALIGANGRNVQRIEADTGAQIKVVMGRKEDEDGPVPVRVSGDKLSQDKAREQIEAFIKATSTCLVDADPETVTRLYDTGVKGKGKGKGAPPPADKISKFGEVFYYSGLTIVRKAKGVMLVGETDAVDKWKGILQDAVTEMGSVPSSVRLSYDQSKLWTPERVEELKSNSGAKVQLVRRGARDQVSILEISGSETEKEKARAGIAQIHDRYGYVETLENLPSHVISSLIARGAAKLKEVQKEFDVTIALDRKTQVMRIVGTKETVAGTRKAMEKMTSTVEAMKEIDIERSEGRLIIGPGGSMVKHIKNTTGLEDLRLEGTETRKVVLRGTEEAVEAAALLVQEALEKARNAPEGEDDGGKGEKGSKGKGRKGNRKGKGKGGDGSGAAARWEEKGKNKSGDGSGVAASMTSEKEGVAGETAGNGGACTAANESEAVSVTPGAEKSWAPHAKKDVGSRQADVNWESTESFPTLGGEAKGKKQTKSSAWSKIQEEAEEEKEEVASAAETGGEVEGGDADKEKKDPAKEVDANGEKTEGSS
eukprot:TRINITY_DN61163_c0_g1_i1.p1 TRINITY_DN61163_c0_g1~~TRINITY_DN61163_c0_g1_i1.p1  ORF type:complete len:976 (-),score=301.71 TRINITY_DN61163_c0_g1_i1:109-3036(-)